MPNVINNGNINDPIFVDVNWDNGVQNLAPGRVQIDPARAIEQNRVIEEILRGNLPPPRGVLPEAIEVPQKKGFPFFRTLLENVKEIYDVEGFVSGGCIRDTMLEVPYKDVDLFLPLNLKTFEESCEELGWQCRGRMMGKNYLKGAPTERYSATSNGQMIDVVLLGENKEDPVSQFPAYWTRARYTLNNGGQLETTEEFNADFAAKTCTVMAGLEQDHLDNLLKRFDQWVERTGLQGWSFKIEGLDKSALQEYIAKKALALKKVVTKKKKSSFERMMERPWEARI